MEKIDVEIIDSDSRSPGFSLRTGYYLAHCSLAAYGGTGDWPRMLALGDSLRTFQCEEFHGFVARHENIRIVAFRGTESIGNALTDLETALIRHLIYPGLVHFGFSLRHRSRLSRGSRPAMQNGSPAADLGHRA